MVYGNNITGIQSVDDLRQRIVSAFNALKVEYSSPENVQGHISRRANLCIELEVGGEVSSDVTLLEYIRDTAELRGTKYMCREGGCGACIVSAVTCPGGPPQAVNSCLVSVTSCQDWEITTVEKVGNKLDGYNLIQKTLAEYNGTQCGYCTPGWIMSMYSLVRSKKDLTMLEIEKSFGSNVCRCTGYRPILEAFKKFAKDAPRPNLLPDIEDLTICKKTGEKCSKGLSNCEKDDWCIVPHDRVIEINLKDGKKWFRVQFLEDIFKIWHSEGVDSYMLVAGNTAKGAYPIFEYPRILIDISGVDELKGWMMDQNLIVGAGVTLSELMDIFQRVAQVEYFEYLEKFHFHLSLVAHMAVRNIGSVAGNLMIKHQHHEFPSDVFLLLTTVSAQLTLINQIGVKQTVTMEQFLTTDMTGQIILNILLPPLNSQYLIVTYKVMPRSQNAHAIVNGGFLYKINEHNRVVRSTVVFGGLSPYFIRANNTETCLIGMDLFRNETLQAAIESLKQELIVTKNYPPEPSAAYRKQLAISLFYKGLLELCPENMINVRYKSGVRRLRESRPVSDAQQTYDTNPSLWPLNKPIPKIEALVQCSGEIPYTEDLSEIPREVFASFVLSQVPSGNILHIDPSKALSYPGVIAFYTAYDIPGENNFTVTRPPLYFGKEEVLCSGEIKHFNQPIGIVVAMTRAIADRAAKLVNVTYKNIRKPLLEISIAKKDPKRLELYNTNPAKNRGNEVVMVIKSENCIHGQYHFTMELLVCVTKPTEQGIEVHSATQWLDSVHVTISRALKMEQSRIDVISRRIGGGYGMKVTRSTQVAVACALVTHKLNRPCRFIPPMTTTTRAIGKRFPCAFDFEVAVNRPGRIQYINCNLYEDNGYKSTEKLAQLGVPIYNNCYEDSRWNFKCYNALTDNPKNTWCRSPSTLEHVAMAETIMERIACELNLDPLEVRLTNLDTTKHKAIKEMVATVKNNANYFNRRSEVNQFNIDNRWKKRGLRFSLLRWDHSGRIQWDVNMSVYHGDGTVSIVHSGIEMGQGVNTKAIQICAYFLNIPIDKITIKGNDTMISPNTGESAGSYTSQYSGLGVQRCCEELLKRLNPIRIKMLNPTWEQLIQKAYESDVDLQVHSFIGLRDVQNYTLYGVTLSEVEIDVLTGEIQILRVDLLQDVGQSVSPEIDIGQVEGAFIMGLGYWTTEHLIYDEGTGELLTDRTWNYYVPQARDIPQDFRVNFRKKSYGNPAILGAKATGEPSICMSISIPFAIREAISSARLESGIPNTQWFQIDGPYTPESISMVTKTDTKDFKFY